MEPALSSPSPVCPYCKGSVSADTLRFGGNCPHCMLEIPGEEAPTDPGLQARLRKEAEEKVAARRRTTKNRIIGAVVTLVLLAAVGGGAAWWKAQEAARTYTMDDYFVLPLEEISGPPPESTAPSAPTPGSNGKQPERKQPKAVPQPGEPTPSADPMLNRHDGSSNIPGDLVPVSGTPATQSGVGIGTGSVAVERLGNDVVLTDPGEIFEMAKRVLNAMSPQLQTCYNQRLKQVADLKGAWRVGFVIAKDGGVKNVSVTPVNGNDAELESCMTRTVGNWKFQKIVKDQPVEKTYRFGPGSW